MLLAAGFPPYHLPYLLPLGVALLLAALRELNVRRAVYAGFVCGFVYFGATHFWLARIFGLACISLIAIEAAFPALFAGLSVWLRRRNPAIPMPILAAIVWTAVEYYRSEPFVLSFGWMGLGYGVVGSAVPGVVASWVGSYGLTFLIVALGGTLLTARPAVRAALFAAWVAMVAVPAHVPAPERPFTARLVQDMPLDDDLVKLSSVRAGEHADLILWPEYATQTGPGDPLKVWPQLQSVARENRCWFVFGSHDQLNPGTDSAFSSAAFVMAPDGHVAGRHVKNHTVHFFDDGIRGSSARAIPTALGRLGVAICFDMDYPDVARRLAADGAELFVVPSMDPPEWGPIQREQHRLMFKMRAAECGRWLVRADVAGGASAGAPTGREFARVPNGNPQRLDVTVGRTSGRTLYVRGGWLTGRLCLIASLALVLWSLPGVRRARR